MGSRSSRTKRDTRLDRGAVGRLLQDGYTVVDPTPDECVAAAALARMGLIHLDERVTVRCVDAADEDYPDSDRRCQGRIALGVAGAEPGREYQCPDCTRLVYPDEFHKVRHRELRVHVSWVGVYNFVHGKLVGFERHNVKTFGDGGYRVWDGPGEVYVCVADRCAERYLARDWAATNATCYVVVDPIGLSDRFLTDEWLCPVALADLVCGGKALKEAVERLSQTGPPAAVSRASVPVYNTGPRPIRAEAARSGPNKRVFVVEVGSDTVCVNGVQVVAPQAGPRYHVFRILWDVYVAAIQKDDAFDPKVAKPVRYFIEELFARTGRRYVDEAVVRRSINRLQADIAAAVERELGIPIGREDIVETVPWSGQRSAGHGYRLNPRHVAVLPIQPDE